MKALPMRPTSSQRSPLRQVFAVCVAAFALLVSAIVLPQSALASDESVSEVVVSSSELNSVVSAASAVGATAVAPMEGSDGLYRVERSAHLGSASQLAADLMLRAEEIRWAVPAEAEVSADPFYAWPFYAWNGAQPVVGEAGYELDSALSLDTAHSYATGQGVTVAVIDTGFNVMHPMIQSQVESGFDFVDGDTDVRDEPNFEDDDGDGSVDETLGHGTHLAGIVAQVAPDARIIPIRALNSDGVGSLHAVVSSIEYAIGRGADVINLSFGTSTDEPALRAVIAEAARQNIVVVAAAGNESTTSARIPSSYPQVLGVAAHDPATSTVADFGNWGEAVDVSAIGVVVKSAAGDNDIGVLTGSSVAAPVVAAQAALLRQYYSHLNAAQISTQIRATSKAVPFEERPTRYGRADVVASLSRGVVPLAISNYDVGLASDNPGPVVQILAAVMPTPAPLITPVPEPARSAEPTAIASPVPTATPLPAAIAEPTAMPRSTPTATPQPSQTMTPEPTATPQPSQTMTPEPTATPWPMVTTWSTATLWPTAAPEPTLTADPEPSVTQNCRFLSSWHLDC